MPRATRNKKKKKPEPKQPQPPKRRVGRPIRDLEVPDRESLTPEQQQELENAHARTCTHMQRTNWPDPDQPNKMRKLQAEGARMRPGTIRGTKLEEQIIELSVFRKWPGKRVVEHLDNSMITLNTVYGVVSRFRKRMQKLDEEAETIRTRIIAGMQAAKSQPQPNNQQTHNTPAAPKHTSTQSTVIEGEVIESTESRESEWGEAPERDNNIDNIPDKLTTEEVFGLAAVDPDSVALAQTGEDPLTIRQRHRQFLHSQASVSMELADNTGRAALTSTKAAQSSEASLRWIKAYQASISQFKELAGLDTDKQSNGNGLHLHAHLHQGGANPFLNA